MRPTDLYLRSVLTAIFCIAFATLPSLAQSWVATTGTLDPAFSAHARFNGQIVDIDSAAPIPSTIKLRYNVLQAGDLITNPNPLQTGECRQLIVRFTDNGTGAQVILRLKQYNLHTGQVTTLLSFDSNAAPTSSSFQIRPSACVAFDFTFADSAADVTSPSASVYFLEATLTRSATGGTPKLGGFGLIRIIP